MHCMRQPGQHCERVADMFKRNSPDIYQNFVNFI